MKIDERHLMQLAAVTLKGSVTAGANHIGMTQSAVSRTLSSLEKHIGEPLFVKGQRPFKPTPIGRALSDQGMTILLASRKASETIFNFKNGQAGTVRVGGTPFFTDALIAGMIAEFQNEFPETRIEQQYGYFPTLKESVLKQEIDVAICPVDIIEEGSGLVFEEILSGRNVIACNSTHPLLRKFDLKLSELSEYSWIAPPAESPLFADMQTILNSLSISDASLLYSGGTLASVLNYLSRSDVLTILPHSVVFAYRDENAISALPFKIPHPDRNLGILRLVKSNDLPVLDNFVDFIVSSFRRLRFLIEQHEAEVVKTNEQKS